MSPSVSVAFIAREKYSRAVESLRSILAEVPADAPVYLTDTLYPGHVRDALAALLDGRRFVRVLKFDRFLLPNAALNEVVRVADGDYLLVAENDVVAEPGAVAEMIRVAANHEASVISPRIMHNESEHAHYDPPLSVIVSDSQGHISLVERIPRNGFSKISGTRRIFHIEKHCFLAAVDGLRAMGEFNPAMNTREQIEFSLMAYDAGLVTYYADDAVVRYYAPPPLEESDLDLFRWRWNEEWAAASNEYVRTRWRLRHFVPSTTFVARMNEIAR